MAVPALQALLQPQWGMEGTKLPTNVPGGSVAATRKMAVMDFLVTPDDEMVRDSILNGLTIANRAGEVVVSRGTSWEVPETPLVSDDMHYWIAMAMTSPVKTGAGPFVWTGTHDPTLVSTRDLRTIEVALRNGNPGDDGAYEIPNSYLQEIEWIGAANQTVKFTAKGRGRRLATQAATGALALPADVRFPTSLCKVFFDNTWAGRGVTQVTGQVIGWRFKVATGITDQHTIDGRPDQDYSLVYVNPEEVKTTFEMDVKANLNTGFWQTQKAIAEAGTIQAVEVLGEVTVSAIAHKFRLQGLFKHTKPNIFPEGRENGLVTAKIQMEGSTDLTNYLALISQNNTTAAIA